MMKATMNEETYAILTVFKTPGYVVSDGEFVIEYKTDATDRLLLYRDWQGYEIVSIEMGSDLRLHITVREAECNVWK